MKYLSLFLCYFMFLGIGFGQKADATFKDKPVIPFSTPRGDKEIDSIKHILNYSEGFELNTLLTRRARSLDFFETMSSIAEPTTVSFFPFDYTINDNKAQQKKPFVLNADVKTPIALGGKRWRMFTLHIIPQFKVRIFKNDTINHDDRSLPVRTPSYLPGAALYFSHRKLWSRNADDNSLKGLYFGIHGFHHSNGQDGPEYIDSETINRYNLKNLRPGQINVYNGNFSELIVGEFIIGRVREFYTKSAFKIPETKLPIIPRQRTIIVEDSTQPNRLFYWRMSYEWHQKKYVTNKEFLKEGLYGRDRLNLQLGYSLIPTYRDVVLTKNKEYYAAVTPFQSKELFRFVLNMNYLTNSNYFSGDLISKEKVGLFDISKRMNLNLTSYWRITGAPNAALFLQVGRVGSDNYNMYFQQSMWHVRAGVAMAFFKFPKTGDFGKGF